MGNNPPPECLYFSVSVCATAVVGYVCFSEYELSDKIVVCVLARCAPAKDYFKELSGHWSWAVQWLQKKARY